MPHRISRHIWKAWCLVLVAILVLVAVKAWP